MGTDRGFRRRSGGAGDRRAASREAEARGAQSATPLNGENARLAAGIRTRPAVTDQLKVRFDYTTTHTRDETTDLGLLRRPGNKTSVAAAVWAPLNELTIAATLVHVSSWVDVNRDTPLFIPRLDAPA